MSTSIYLVSSNEITSEDAVAFLTELLAVDINKDQASGLVTKDGANVWINFLGSSVLKESDNDEIETWSDCLGRKPHSFFELTIGKSEGSMELAVKVAKASMHRWTIVVDDLDDAVYNEDNLEEILAP